MARALRIEYPGAVYHVTSRGNERRVIFLDDEDREQFLQLLADTITRFGWILTAYTLMANHLVVETPTPTLSRGMQHRGSHLESFLSAVVAPRTSRRVPQS